MTGTGGALSRAWRPCYSNWRRDGIAETAREMAMNRIDTLADIERGMDALRGIDPRLAPIIDIAGKPPLRRSEPGFASLASIIVSQQVSTASAGAIFGRMVEIIDPLTPEAILAADDEMFRAIGLSRPKQRTVLAISEAVAGGLDLHALCDLPAGEAIGQMTAITGVGLWTAEVYLLSAAGHPDVFPARDVALQNAVGDAFAMDVRPGERELVQIAESWAPWRSVGARLFWEYYRVKRGREAAPSA